jgi:hypothetical protein
MIILRDTSWFNELRSARRFADYLNVSHLLYFLP